MQSKNQRHSLSWPGGWLDRKSNGRRATIVRAISGWLAGLRLINVGARRRSNRAILQPGASPVAAPLSVSNHVPHVFRVIPSMAGLRPVKHGFVLVSRALGLFLQVNDDDLFN